MWDWLTFFDRVEHRPIVFRVKQIRWHSPPSRFVKLNIDGCMKGNPGVSGGDEIFRRSEGRLLFAFSTYLG